MYTKLTLMPCTVTLLALNVGRSRRSTIGPILGMSRLKPGTRPTRVRSERSSLVANTESERVSPSLQRPAELCLPCCP